MKNSFRSLLLGAAVLTVPQFASASVVLTGFHNFNGSAAGVDENAPGGGNFALGGFSGQIMEKQMASIDGFGCLDGIYGSTDITGDNNWVTKENNLSWNSIVISTQTDGALVADQQRSFVYATTNNLSYSIELECLLFDAASPLLSPGGSVAVEWGKSSTGIAAVPWDNLMNFGTAFNVYKNLPTELDDYNDATANLTGTSLASGETVYFRFKPENGEMQFDNIALMGLGVIPEPGSLVALGCLVGSGAFLRTRRRNVRL
jgi:hypothetical protein